MDWEFRISGGKMVYTEWTNNKVLLYSTGNYIQYPGINHNRTDVENKRTDTKGRSGVVG